VFAVLPFCFYISRGKLPDVAILFSETLGDRHSPFDSHIILLRSGFRYFSEQLDQEEKKITGSIVQQIGQSSRLDKGNFLYVTPRNLRFIY
jgi:hypothetical protein